MTTPFLYIPTFAPVVNGAPVPNGLLFTYQAGTTNPKPTFADAAGIQPNTNPVVLDITGATTVRLEPGSYHFVLTDSTGTTVLWDQDFYNAPYLTASDLGTLINPNSDDENSLQVVPAFYTYSVSPRIDARRYMSAWDDNSDQTVGLQTAINLAFASKGRVILANGLNVKSGALSLTMPGNRSNQGIAIEGPGWNGATITQTGSPTALLTFTGSTPNTNPTEAPIVLEGFTLTGVGNTAHGILLNGVAMWTLRGIQLSSFNNGIRLQSSLLGLVDCCQSGNNNYGLLSIRNGGSGSGCNTVSVRDSEFNLNSTQGIYLASGDGWVISGCQVESCGTSGDLTTGAIRIVATIDDEFGLATVKMEGIHIEGTSGQPFQVDNTSGLFLDCNTMTLVTGEGNREIRIQGASCVSLTNIITGTGDVIDITANIAHLRNVQCTTLTDTGVTYPIYEGVITNAGTMASGRFTSATISITGAGTVTPVLVNFYRQGQECTAEFTSGITGTSTTTSCTLAGIPLSVCPPSGQTRTTNLTVTNNNVTQGMNGTLDSTGVLTLNWNGSTSGFTASGSKGVPAQSFRWRIP